MLAQLAEQQFERGTGDVLSLADRCQWHGAVPLARRDIDHGCQGEAALGRQTHGVFLVDGPCMGKAVKGCPARSRETGTACRCLNAGKSFRRGPGRFATAGARISFGGKSPVPF
jgi:hypothetical protein